MTLTMMDFVEKLKNVLKTDDNFNFSILVEASPIKKRFSYTSKIIAVIVKIDKLKFIHFDELQKYEWTYIEIKENNRRKVGKRSTPFFIDGNTTIQTFKECDFVQYSFRNPNKKDLIAIDRIRDKYDITPPKEFVGEVLHFDEEEI
jgi:hypothetical protein